MDLQLIIRAPNQNIEDQVIDCHGDWTVLQLKGHLSEVYPSKPAIQGQKLIYSGHLLSDTMLLKDVIRPDTSESNVHILHLVYNGSCAQPPKKKTTSSQAARNQNRNTESNSIPPVNLDTPTESTLRHRTQPFVPGIFNYQMPAGASPMAYTAEQTAAIQHMYEQYYGQYCQSMATLTGNPDMFRALSNYQTQQSVTTDTQVASQPQVNQRANAVARVADDAEHNQRDWLDKIYQCCRYFLLLSILFCYSTPERLMLVVLGVVIAMLYREGWFMRQAIEDVVLRRRNNAQPEVGANVAAENVNDQALPNENAPQDGQELEAAMDGENPPHAQNPDAENNNQGFSAFSIIAAFFFSLVPDPPPPVNIN